MNNKCNIKELCLEALKNDCWGFDTAPSYKSEEYLGLALNSIIKEKIAKREQIFLSTKIDGWQMAKSNGDIEKYVDNSLVKLKVEYLDLLLVHWPFERYLYDTWISMKKMVEMDKVKNIGICNVNQSKYNHLIEKSLITKPDFIQNEITPLRTCKNEVVYFAERGIRLMAYSPLARMDNRIRESAKINNIAHKYDVSIPQIILKWHTQRSIIPVFTSRKIERVFSNLQLKDFSLTDNDISKIESLNCNFKIFPESFGCPGY